MSFVHKDEQYTEERKRYFRLHLLHSIVLNVAHNKGKKLKDYASSSQPPEGVTQINFDVKNFVAMSAALSQLQSDSSVKYMGLEKECLTVDGAPLKKKFTEIVTLGDIKHAVKDYSLKVLSYHGQRPSRELAFSQITEFSKSLSIEKEEMKLIKMDMEETKQDQELLKSCFQETTLCINLLAETLKTFQAQVEVYPILSAYYHSKVKAVLFKIKNLDLELLRKTYRKKKVSALTKIQGQLHSWKEELENSYMQKSVALKTYKCAGASLEHLAKEYSNLLIAIKNEKWAIEEIEKAENQHQNDFC